MTMRHAGFHWGVCIAAPIALLLASCRSSGGEEDQQSAAPLATAYMCELAFRPAYLNKKDPNMTIPVYYEVVKSNIPTAIDMQGATFATLKFRMAHNHGGIAQTSNPNVKHAFQGAGSPAVYLRASGSGTSVELKAFIHNGTSWNSVDLAPTGAFISSSGLSAPVRRYYPANTNNVTYEHGVVEVEMCGLTGTFLHFGQ